MVIAARLGIDPRRTSEFSHPHDERRVEQAAVLQVRNQSGECRINLSGKRSHPIEVVVVRVPAGRFNFDARHSLLDQATSQQTPLAELRPPVSIARGIAFLR